MRRHVALQPLSRFHRSILFLSLLAKRNGPELKGYPTAHEEKVDYAISFYHECLLPHFQVEERLLYPVVEHVDPEIDQMLAIISNERAELEKLFDLLAEERSEQVLNEIGDLLEKHVRREERQLFESIQEKCDERLISSLRL